MVRLLFIAGALLGLLSVVFGAFGAHALRGKLSADLLHSFETATHYQFMHALALLVIATLAYLMPDNRLIAISGNTLLAGTLLFCGSIYLLVLTPLRHLGTLNLALITPLGGSILIIGWLLLLVATIRL